MPDSTVDVIRHALSVARKHGFAEVLLETPESTFEAKLERRGKRPSGDLSEGDIAPTSETPLKEITSPLVGYYRSSEPALHEGQAVEPGQVVAIVTALGLANDVECHVSGEVSEVLVKGGQAVEFGQVLARVKVLP